jgi:hypothetical protein
MKSFHDREPFKALLLADKDVTAVLPASTIEAAFKLDDQLRNVDAIFSRVFSGAGVAASVVAEVK